MTFHFKCCKESIHLVLNILDNVVLGFPTELFRGNTVTKDTGRVLRMRTRDKCDDVRLGL